MTILQVDVDIGSSAVANGVLGLVFGVITTLVVDMAFLIPPLDNLCFFQASLTTACFLTVALDLQANTYDELPEQLLGAARLSNIQPSAAVNPELDSIS